MQKTTSNGSKQCDSQKRGFSLPTTTAKPPMPPVKPPKKASSEK